MFLYGLKCILLSIAVWTVRSAVDVSCKNLLGVIHRCVERDCQMKVVVPSVAGFPRAGPVLRRQVSSGCIVAFPAKHAKIACLPLMHVVFGF